MAWSTPIVSLAEGLGANGGTSSGIDTTGADFLIVAASSYDLFTAPTLSDSKSNTWTALTAEAGSGDGPRVQMFYCRGGTVGSGHTFSLSGANTFCSIAVAAFSGSKATSPFDAESAGATAAGVSTLDTGSVTPSEDNEIVFSALAMEAADDPTIGDSMTRIVYVNLLASNYVGVALGYIIQTTAGAVNPTWSWTGSFEVTGATACFKAEPGGGGSILPLVASDLADLRDFNDFRG